VRGGVPALHTEKEKAHKRGHQGKRCDKVYSTGRQTREIANGDRKKQLRTNTWLRVGEEGENGNEPRVRRGEEGKLRVDKERRDLKGYRRKHPRKKTGWDDKEMEKRGGRGRRVDKVRLIRKTGQSRAHARRNRKYTQSK